MEYTMEMINEHICPEGEYAGYVWLAWTDENGDEHYYPAVNYPSPKGNGLVTAQSY